ncbi:MAG: HAD family hydrolase [Phycisphaerales bacterium]|nr:HAD family hydrolase [Phycisphaerales bacterium]
MLVLFDIDGTLLRTEGAGMRAMLETFRALHGDLGFTLEGVQMAGGLDKLIWTQMCMHHGLETSTHAHARFRTAYGERLQADLTVAQTRAMPGAAALVQAAHSCGAGVGLLTGNYEHTAHIKVACAGIPARSFPFGAFGDEGASRRDLPPLAIARACAHHGRAFESARTIVIGDTPLDVDCAKANGCLAIGVATGPMSREVLADAGADLAVDTLADTQTLIAWMQRMTARAS